MPILIPFTLDTETISLLLHALDQLPHGQVKQVYAQIHGHTEAFVRHAAEEQQRAQEAARQAAQPVDKPTEVPAQAVPAVRRRKKTERA